MIKFTPLIAVAVITVGCSGSPDRAEFDGWFDYSGMRENPNYRDHPQCPRWTADQTMRHKRNKWDGANYPHNPDDPKAHHWCGNRCNPNNCTIQFKRWYRYNRTLLFSEK